MKKLSFVLAYLLLAVPSGAGIITVDNDGPADFNKIQAAINAANEGNATLQQNCRCKLS